jgi:hypothetical protein
MGRRLGRNLPMVAGSGEAEGGQALEDGRIPSRSASAGGDASGFASQAKHLGRAKDEPACGAPAAPRPPGPEHQGTAWRGSDRTRMPSTTERDHRLGRHAARTIAGQDGSHARLPRQVRHSRRSPPPQGSREPSRSGSSKLGLRDVGRDRLQPRYRRTHEQARPRSRHALHPRVGIVDTPYTRGSLDLGRHLGDPGQPVRPARCSEQHNRLRLFPPSEGTGWTGLLGRPCLISMAAGFWRSGSRRSAASALRLLRRWPRSCGLLSLGDQPLRLRIHRPLNRERDLDRPRGRRRRIHDPVGMPATPWLRCSLAPLATVPHPCAPEPASVGPPGADKR